MPVAMESPTLAEFFALLQRACDGNKQQHWTDANPKAYKFFQAFIVTLAAS